MGLFDRIKEKLGVSNEAQKKAELQNPEARDNPSTDPVIDSERPTAAQNATTGPGQYLDENASSQSAAAGAAAPVNTTPVDVTAHLDDLAQQHWEKLDWRNSIVDLLKLLGLDSDLETRKSLATELGCPPEKMADSAQMNIWLHRAVMRKLAENGGTVPEELARAAD
ncbi:DUF3597 domain-containing protein [Stutzerimonas azotifigens]|uniref:DUF3597 domain-containing protein n=1 Tax=Stutzerimonas azotifigens TaxID=291995 RepID=A0ABR5Z212_9GAMM|nr:DUF3597 domain-containing protein [Stutzerimonas azotifigens]MBA1274218.1 DUF3597 domain-containing protein [Stutzerimonas azotifigens]